MTDISNTTDITIKEKVEEDKNIEKKKDPKLDKDKEEEDSSEPKTEDLLELLNSTPEKSS